MKQPRRQGQLKLHYNTRKRSEEPEHGDWRVRVDNPEEAEHLVNPPMGMWKRMEVRTELLHSSDSGWGQQVEAARAGWEKIRGPKRWFRLFLSCVLLLPLSVIMLFALLVQLYTAAPDVAKMESIGFWMSEPVWYTLMGSLVFAILTIVGVAPSLWVFVYVLGHELTHAIAAKLSFGNISAFRVNKDGGYVETDADNTFVALSPYFVPLWLLCWLGVLWLANLVCPFECFHPWFYAGIGFWGCFHIYWTIWIIPREQPDMLSNGIMFSTLVIFIMNVVVLLGVLRLFNVLSLQGYGKDFLSCAGETYDTFAELLVFGWKYLMMHL